MTTRYEYLVETVELDGTDESLQAHLDTRAEWQLRFAKEFPVRGITYVRVRFVFTKEIKGDL